MPTILVSALEASSNMHLEELRRNLPKDYRFIGVFESKEALYSPREFSVMGFRDVIGRLGFLLKAHKEMVRLAKQADMVLLMDSSSFNIPLAKKIKKQDPHKKSCIIFYRKFGHGKNGALKALKNTAIFWERFCLLKWAITKKKPNMWDTLY